MTRLISAFRVTGILEGLSFIVLLLVAMPLKYIAKIPEGVAVVGAIHGGLFIVYVALAILTTIIFRWPLKYLGQAIVASLVPAGTFWFDRKLHKLQLETAPNFSNHG